MISVNRLWILGAAIVAIGLAALGYFFGISPQLAARATAQSTLASVRSSNAQLSQKVGTLAAESRKLGTLQSQYDALNSAMPDSSSTSSFVSQLSAAAASTGVTVTGVTVSDAAPYAAPVAPAAPTSTSTASPAPAPAPQSSSAGMPPFTSSQVTGSTMAVIPVTVQANGSDANVLRFIKAVQTMKRYYLVTGVSTSPGTGSGAAAAGGLAASLTGEIFSITGQATPAPAK